MTWLFAIVVAAVKGRSAKMIALEATDEFYALILTTVGLDRAKTGLVVILVTAGDRRRVLAAIT